MDLHHLKQLDQYQSIDLEKIGFKYTLKIENGLDIIFEKESKPAKMLGDCLLDAHRTIEELIHQTSKEAQDIIIAMSGKEPETEEERKQIIEDALRELGYFE